ncbi:SPOR domain-containing protein [Treponema socranskii]|uniref:SPOR domain-containing protein n=1 Tax=Treponema socranskii TaxID=53419 RepID=UPI003D6FC919
MKRRGSSFAVLLLLIFLFPLAADEARPLTARAVADAAAAKPNVDASIAYIEENLPKVSEPKEKRALYAFFGSLQEQLARFDDARASYAEAAAISAGDAESMPKKSSEQLVLDAVRCALSSGDYTTAERYLNSAVRNSKDEAIQARIKLYALWAELCRANVSADLDESVAMLKAYMSFKSMASVKPAVLLTLWYLTGDASYAAVLKKEFPASLETGIVKGGVQLLPAPFWYFLPRKEAALPEIDSGGAEKIASTEKDAGAVAPQKAESKKNSGQSRSVQNVAAGSESSGASKTGTGDEQGQSAAAAQERESSLRRLQLGLFREKANADRLVAALKDKGFTAAVTTETRASGTTYYIVAVDETDGSIGDKLRTAGFEFYPL